MTDPTQAKQVRTSSGNNARRYSWPPHPPHEFTVSSVTSSLKAIPKPFLINWAKKVTAEGAVRDIEIVNLMLKQADGKKAAIEHIKKSMDRDSGAKGDRGTIVHAAVDAYLSGKPYTKEQMEDALKEKFVPDHMFLSTAGMISGVMEFLWEVEPEILWNEATVFSRQHLYGGTADIIAKLQVGGTFQPAVIDVKTSKSIYDEVALQLVAYARADFVGLNDGTEMPLLPWTEDDVEPDPIKYGIVIRPKADGTYERADYTLTDDLFELFLSLKSVQEALDEDILKNARRPGAPVVRNAKKEKK